MYVCVHLRMGDGASFASTALFTPVPVAIKFVLRTI